jgi:hypothetical protein
MHVPTAIGANQCPKREKATLSVDVGQKGGTCVGESGYEEAGVVVTISLASQQVFSGAGLTAALQSKLFDSSTQYTIFLANNVNGQQQVVFQQHVGAPVDNELDFTSPFQGGFQWPMNGYMTLIACYES